MAQRHHSLQMTELADVMDTVLAFEQHNTVKLYFRFNVGRVGRRPEVFLTVEAFTQNSDVGEVASLACENVACSSTNLRTWNAVLTHVLYALDFQLALNEFGSVAEKRA